MREASSTLMALRVSVIQLAGMLPPTQPVLPAHLHRREFDLYGSLDVSAHFG